jgi:hypothetical protein
MGLPPYFSQLLRTDWPLALFLRRMAALYQKSAVRS